MTPSVIDPTDQAEPRQTCPLIVVTPTYNEAGSLPGLVQRLLALPLPELRVLVVDDNSPDGTGKLADEIAHTTQRVAVLHRATKDGLGRAYIDGFTAVLNGLPWITPFTPEWVVQIDADGSHPVEEIPGLLGTALAARAQLVIGSRYVPGGSIDGEWGINRRWLSAFGNWYLERILHLGIRDATAGFKVWSADTLRMLNLSQIGAAGYAFQAEMNYLAVRSGCRVVEVPIHFTDRTAGTSKMSFGVKLESALRPWSLRWRYRRQRREVSSSQAVRV
ncbi:MAG: polyprenol monophosphomannose synthase [Pseudonocardiaceae bacterium]